MSKVYLILYKKKPDINQKGLISFLENKGVIEYWEYCLPNSIIIKSNKSSVELSKLIDKKYGTNLIHLITEIHGYYGRLPDGYWDLIEHPEKF